jgi:hypothetical protein
LTTPSTELQAIGNDHIAELAEATAGLMEPAIFNQKWLLGGSGKVFLSILVVGFSAS